MDNDLWNKVVLNWRNKDFKKANRTKSDEQLEGLREFDQLNDFTSYYSKKFVKK